CTRPGVLLQVATDRVLRGRPFTSRRNRISNNIFYTADPVVLLDIDNTSDNNLFFNQFDLAKWQAQGYDLYSRQPGLLITFDRNKTQLFIKSEQKIPVFTSDLDSDFYNIPRHGHSAPGPFMEIPDESVNLYLKNSK
ncbi:hypothetical protein JW935_19325, partial [candidate division KSB1 bacterium]|nr:hypothetical protein [candidate division KSB1 bacterium]